MLGGKHNATLFTPADAGHRPAVTLISASAHFDKHHGAAGLTHNQVNLTAAPTRCSVVANQQLQSLVLQIGQGLFLCVIPELFGGVSSGLLKGVH
jgi:hypothetical protein